MGNRITKWFAIFAIGLALAAPAVADEPGWCKRTWNWLTTRCTKEKQDAYKKSCRSCVEDWFDESARPEYGLKLLDAIEKKTRLVVFIHGLNSRPEDLNALISEAQTKNLACATFRFPNDQPIADSSEALAEALTKFHVENPQLSLSIVAHSMGGLVTRHVIESNTNTAWYIDQLIMLAPPNHGSNLAKYACSLDLWEYATSKRRRSEANLIVGSFADGLAEATDDLEPGSKFITQLNQNRRNKNVKYTIVIGTKGSVSASKTQLAKTVVRKVSKPDSWVRKATNKIENRIDQHAAVVNGLGDGIVSVQSAKLLGVEDIVYGHFSHGEILHSEPTDEVREVRKKILQRLVRAK